MQEINRGVALLGTKTQECNTGDKRLLSPTCTVDRTIGLLSVSDPVAMVAGQVMPRRLDHPPIPLAWIRRTEQQPGDQGRNRVRPVVC
jgi:hypothetical protein